MLQPFEQLRETLLRAGVAPTHVRRYVRELADHVADIAGEELEAGRAPEDAKATARARLGSDETLARAMLAQPALRSWTGRAPWATLFVGPMLLLVLAWLLAFLSARLLSGHYDANGRPLPFLPLAPAGSAMLDLAQVAAPVLIAATAAFLAARQRSRRIWPLLGCLTVAYFGGGLVWSTHTPPGSWPFLTVNFQWGHSLLLGSLSLAVAGMSGGLITLLPGSQPPRRTR